MTTCEIVVLVWLVFDLLVYAYLVFDEMYFSNNVRNRCKRIKEAFTEE